MKHKLNVQDNLSFSESVNLEIKRDLHKEYLILAKELYKQSEPGKKTPYIGSQRKRLLIGSLIFIALALESFINDSGNRKLKKFNKLERLSFPTKWLIFPKLIKNINIDLKKGKGVLQSIKEIYDYRNFFAHYKPKFTNVNEKWERKYNNFNHKEIEKYYKNTIIAMKTIAKGFPKEYDWLVEYPENI